MKLAGTVILYNPPENTIENIFTYIDDIELLYIFDNSPQKAIIFPNEILNKSEYVHSGINEGIAKRLNEAIIKAKTDGFDYLLTMDQDSSFKNEDLKKYLESIKSLENNYKTLMYGIRYYDLKENENIEPKVDAILITSGSIINITSAYEVGWFDENLFIDEVDREYCMRGMRMGYSNILINNLKLIHNEGTQKKVLLPNLKFGFRMIHNPKRMYYKMRNFILIRKKYPEYKYLTPFSNQFNVLKNNILYGNNKFKTIYYTIKGLLSGLK